MLMLLSAAALLGYQGAAHPIGRGVQPAVLQRRALVLAAARTPPSEEEEEKEEWEVVVPRPLGIRLEQKEGIGPVVAMVYEGGNAALQGVSAGDVVVATSASIGSGMWSKTTVEGVISAIQTRVDGQVRLRLRRPLQAVRPRSWEEPLVHTFEVTLERPLGLGLRERETGDGDGAGAKPSVVPPWASRVEVAGVAEDGSASASGAICTGDLVVATSGTVGEALWEKSSLEGVLAAISTRLALVSSVTLRLQRWRAFGPWARELHQISTGERRSLSAAAVVSLRAQRRDWRLGLLAGERVHEVVRDLTTQVIARCGRGLAPKSYDCRLLRGSLRRLRMMHVSMDARLANAAMSAALRLGDPDLSLAIFDRMDDEGGAADTKMYTTSIKAHAMAGRFAEALAVEQRMSADRVPLNVRTYNTLMSVCARAGDRKGMVRYFMTISERGMRPSLESWNVVLSYCARIAGPSGVAQADDVLRRMRSSGVRPDAVSFSCLARAIARAGDVSRFETIFQTMEEDGIVGDTELLNTLLLGYAKSLRWDLAQQLLERWRAEGVRADADSFAHVIRACASARVPMRAMQTLQTMREAGVRPTLPVYSMVLSSLAKEGKVRDSIALLRQMRDDSIAPNGHIYAALMQLHVTAGEPTTARELFQQMERSGIDPDAVTYTLLIRAILSPSTASSAGAGAGAAAALGLVGGTEVSSAAVGAGKTVPNAPTVATRRNVDPSDDAMRVLRDMHARGGRCAPNTVTYNALLDGLLARGETERALAVLKEMLGMVGLSPNRQTFVSLAGCEVGKGSDLSMEWRRPLADARTAAAHVDFSLRTVTLFERHNRKLSGDFYLAALHAAKLAGDVAAAHELSRLRNEVGLFQLRQRHKQLAAEAEAGVSAWERQAGVDTQGAGTAARVE